MENLHFYSANEYYKQAFGKKMYRLSLDGGFTCPNRDGSVSFGGCTFCSAEGSGDFAVSASAADIEAQIERAKEKVIAKKPEGFIAYFQSFTSTYKDVNELRVLYSSALKLPDVLALSIATRPDCVCDACIELLKELQLAYQKPIYIELGLQTINDDIANEFNRGYKTEVFYDTLSRLNEASLPVIVHMILGLPDETPEDIVHNVKAVAALPIHGIKLSLLHILRGTKMENSFSLHPERFHVMSLETYLQTLGQCLEIIPKNVVIYRITGDAPKKLLIAPEFTADKKRVLNSINTYLTQNNIIQGSGLEEICKQKP